MYFPTADIQVAPWLPPLVAFIISLFTSMGGVSGAFLLLPFQMSFLGFTNPAVSSTNQVFNIVAIPSGVYRYIREGRMVWPLTWVIVIGTLPGVLIGAVIRVAYLPDPRNFKLFTALVLLYIGGRMIRDLLGRNSRGSRKVSGEDGFQQRMCGHLREAALAENRGKGPLTTVRVGEFSLRRVSYEFCGERFDIPIWEVMALSFAVGIVGGVYGIGGGAIIAPFLVSFLRLPVYTVAGAALMGTFVTSVAGVAFYHAVAPFYPSLKVAPDWTLGLLFGLGGMVGMYLGARLQKFAPAGAIKWMLAGVMLFTALRYVWDFLK